MSNLTQYSAIPSKSKKSKKSSKSSSSSKSSKSKKSSKSAKTPKRAKRRTVHKNVTCLCIDDKELKHICKKIDPRKAKSMYNICRIPRD